MKSKLKFIIPLILLIALTVTACELPRQGDDSGDIAVSTPALGTTPATTAAPAVTTVPPTSEPATAQPSPPTISDIDPAGVPAPLPPPNDIVEPGKVLVRLEPQAAVQALNAEPGSDNIVTANISSLDEKLRQIGATELEPILEDVATASGQDVNEFTIQVEQVGPLYFVSYNSGENPVEVARFLEEDPNVEYAEPNYIAGIAGSPARYQPNDPYYRYQWNMPNINMPTAWDSSTGEGVIVAIIDTGVDFNAPDLANTRHLPGFDFVNNDNDPTDDQGHGTHVAGTVAQSTNNGLGVVGIAFNAIILPVKVLGATGTGTYENIIKGISYAVEEGADVINMSLAGAAGSQGLRDAVNYAHSRGVVVVAATGNSGSNVAFPAGYDDYVIGVGAVRYDNTKTAYSNFGPELDIMAPGGDIKVDQNNDGFADGILQQTIKPDGSYGYLFYEGTSMASPHIAGVAALLLSLRPELSPNQVEAIMAQTAKKVGVPNEYGAGVVQADAAIAALGPPQSVTSTPTPVAATFTPTATPPGPTATPIATAVEPTFTPTSTSSPLPPTFTPTSMPSTFTPTFTPLPPTFTSTPTQVPPTHTTTPLPPTFTPTPTPSPMDPTITPTSGPTLTPAPGELLLNGSFESDEAWVFGDTPVRGSYDNQVVHSGQRSVKLGITDSGDAYSFTSVWQKVAIPPDATQVTLKANIYPVSQDRPGTDIQNILILDQYYIPIRTLSRGLSNNQQWEEVTYNLSDLRGQTIFIYFSVFNRGYSGRPSALFVDDVSLIWSR